MDVDSKRKRLLNSPLARAARVLLVGPYDPHCGEFTFLAPPLGVWRLQGFLAAQKIEAVVFDPNRRPEAIQEEFDATLRDGPWDVIGLSTTGMTLQYDLSLAHRARELSPNSLLVAGGMEATFKPQLLFLNGPFDLIVTGEGERPLSEICARRVIGQSLEGIAGTVVVRSDGELQHFPGAALNEAQLTGAIFSIPYEHMPYQDYWNRLERAYDIGGLPYKAQREAALAEIRSVRLITLNYCPMGCSFCSSTNFLHQSQGSIAGIARLSAEDCLRMMERIVVAHPSVKTIIFQDDIFVFTTDKRILPLCEQIIEAKRAGRLPAALQFISTNRIDAMNPERLAAMRRAGFRVLGFGIESFSQSVLTEFNKKHIYRHIEPVLLESRRLGITPFLDLILTSPRSSLGDLAETVRQAYRWIVAGCEVGIYPYVIPFSGAAMSRDPELIPQTIFERRRIPGTAISWSQPVKILPLDDATRAAILRIETDVQAMIAASSRLHLPSRVRSLMWIRAAVPVLRECGESMPDESGIALTLHEDMRSMSLERCAAL